MKLVHHACATFCKMANAEGLQEREQSLHGKATKEAFERAGVRPECRERTRKTHIKVY